MKCFSLISGVCLLFLAAGCGRAPRSTLVSEPLRDRPARAEGAPLFEKLTPARSGVAFSHRMAMDHPLSRLNSSGFVCGGVCIGDFNGDGRPDLFLANGPDKNGLFLQRDGFRFEDVTQQATPGHQVPRRSISTAMVTWTCTSAITTRPTTSLSTTAREPVSPTRRRRVAWQ